MNRAPILLVLLLAGCEHTIERVEVPIPVPCRVEVPEAPQWATAGLTTDSTVWEKVRALLAERRQRIAYEAQLRAAIDGCNGTLSVR